MGVFWQHTLGKSWDRSILTQEDVSAELARRGFEDGDPMDHIRGRYTFPRDDVVLMKTLNMMVKLCCDWQGGDYRRVCGFYVSYKGFCTSADIFEATNVDKKAPYVYAIDNHGAIMRRLEEDGYWVDEAAGKRWGVQFLLIHGTSIALLHIFQALIFVFTDPLFVEAPRNIVEKMGDWYTGRVAITDESFAVLKERGICQAPKFVGVRYEDA